MTDKESMGGKGMEQMDRKGQKRKTQKTDNRMGTKLQGRFRIRPTCFSHSRRVGCELLQEASPLELLWAIGVGDG
jgi:hypothetical protein